MAIAFPHETDMDQLSGVDFAKGCYVGQEVVSRIEHRGSARTRVVPVATRICARRRRRGDRVGKTVGTLGSTADGRGLAMLRLDRIADAMQRVSAGERRRNAPVDQARLGAVRVYPGPPTLPKPRLPKSKIAESKAAQS